MHTSWWTLREQLRTHQVVTVVLPTKDGKVLFVRARFSPLARKSCSSAARSFKFHQDLQSHPGYHFIKAVIA